MKGQGGTLNVTAGSDFTEVKRVKAENPERGEFGAVTGDQVVCP